MSDDIRIYNEGLASEARLLRACKAHPEWEQLYKDKGREMFTPIQ